jgi:ATP-dependent Clp protease adaptor protein ClpS
MSDIFNTLFQEEEDVLLAEATTSTETAQLIVYNDDHNTFDWVIQCFMEVCNHSFIQAEQLSLFVHFKGKATVKTGSMEELKPMKDALVDRGLSAVIETFIED